MNLNKIEDSHDNVSKISEEAENGRRYSGISEHEESLENLPQIPSIKIDNSKEIRVGSEILYNGPVVYNVDVLHMHKGFSFNLDLSSADNFFFRPILKLDGQK
jgi:hypothetical protein